VKILGTYYQPLTYLILSSIHYLLRRGGQVTPLQPVLHNVNNGQTNSHNSNEIK